MGVHLPWLSILNKCPVDKGIKALNGCLPQKCIPLCGYPLYMSMISMVPSCSCFITVDNTKVEHNVSISDKLKRNK